MLKNEELDIDQIELLEYAKALSQHCCGTGCGECVLNMVDVGCVLSQRHPVNWEEVIDEKVDY